MEIDDISIAEISVLAIFTNNPDIVYEYQYLPPEIFTSSVNKNLFKAIVTLTESSLTPDYNLLYNTLISNNMIESCGGKDYLMYLKEYQCNKNNIQAYIDILIKAYKRRRLISIVNTLDNSFLSLDKIDDVLFEIKNNLDNIISLNKKEEVSTIEIALQNSLEQLENKMRSSNIARTTGFNHLDSVTGGFSHGDLWYVAGRPGMGKTAWCLNSINNSIERGTPNLMFSLEMNGSSLIYRLLAIRTGISGLKLKLGIITKEELDKLYEEKEKIKKFPLYINNNFDTNISYIKSVTKKYVQSAGIEVVHIDYLQLIDIPSNNNSVREFTNISRSLKVLANELGISIVAYSQLNRGVESRPDKRPILSDLRESGGLEQDADVVIMLYRDSMYNANNKEDIMENIIRKHREGPTGTLFSVFNPDTNKITEKF